MAPKGWPCQAGMRLLTLRTPISPPQQCPPAKRGDPRYFSTASRTHKQGFK